MVFHFSENFFTGDLFPLRMPHRSTMPLSGNTLERGGNWVFLFGFLCFARITTIGDGGLSRITVTSLLSASANGKKAVDALAGQSAKLLNGIPIDEDDFFGRQLAFNMLPLLPDREGSVREERRIVDEVRKILQDDGLMISASVVQSPVFYGHAQMVGFEALRPLAAEEARDAFGRGEDIVLSEESEFPTQVGDATGSAHLSVGCVRNDYGMPEQVQFWSVADNVRFGGALMAVKIAEKLVQEYLY